ncbi:MAG: response regulator [Myxococcaceae bacterium]
MAHTPTHTRSPESLQQVAPDRTARPLVLVIDPDESTRSVLEVALVRDGFEVWSASGSREGMLLLTGRQPDVIVLESDLGGDDGFTFVAQLRGDERTSKVPVVLLARSDDQNVEAMADVVGVDDFIQKPAFARDVAAMVRLELARRAQSDGPVFFDTKVLPPVQLLRALLSCPRSGRLFLVNGRAEIRFRAGKVIDARFDGKGSDLDTVVRALALTIGEYSLVLEAIDGFAELQCGLREVVDLVVPRLQRWGRVLQRSLPLDAQLTVDFSRLAGALKAMPDEVNRVVQLFDGFRTVEEVLVDSHFNETLSLEVATRLYLMGVLVPVKDATHEIIVLKPMPRLFEPRAGEAEELMQQLFAGTAEIRAPEAAADDEEEHGDWFALTEKGTGLEVADPNGGWTTAPVPESLASGLSPELARQLDAFQTPMQVEARERPADEVEMTSFAHRDHAAAASATAIEVALMQASEGELVSTGDDEVLYPSAHDPQLDLEAETHRAQARGRQARIETPWMTPVVEVKESAPATVVAAPSVEVKPEVAEPKPAFVAGEADAEAAFFASTEATLSAETTLPASATVAAPAVTEPTVSSETVIPPAKTDRRMWPFVVAAIAITGVGLIIDFATADDAQPEVVVAPAGLPDVEPPTFYAEEAAPAVEEQPAPEAAIDISENLTEARKLYEGGQYKKAISVLEQAITDDPKSTAAWNLMGLAKYDSMDIVGARAAADKVLELEPNNARVQILIATLHFDANEKDLGRAALEKYLELDPNGPHAEEAKALLKR